MDSIQRLRHSALNVGNLQSTPQQQVIDDGGYIEIVPADPQVIYVPVYQPDQVYYQTCYGPPFITFGIGFPIGLWLNCDFDWWHHHIIVWGHNHPRPPNWWHEQHHQRDTGHTTVWHPHNNYPAARGANHGDRGWSVAHNRTVPPTRGCHGRPVRVRFSGAATDTGPGGPPAGNRFRCPSPGPRRLPLNMLNPLAGRNQPAHSSASRVRATQEPIAIAASKACRPSPILNRFRTGPACRACRRWQSGRRRRWRWRSQFKFPTKALNLSTK